MGNPEQESSQRGSGWIGRRLPTLRSADRLVIFALITVVCLVSLPRLASYVQRSNEGDARRALAILGPYCCTPDSAPAPASPTDMATWPEQLKHRLGDARPLEDSSALLYHGYLFSLRPAPEASPWLVAWPRKAGRTGDQVYAWSPDMGTMTPTEECRLRWSIPGGDPGPIQPAEWKTSRPAGHRP